MDTVTPGNNFNYYDVDRSKIRHRLDLLEEYVGPGYYYVQRWQSVDGDEGPFEKLDVLSLYVARCVDGELIISFNGEAGLLRDSSYRFVYEPSRYEVERQERESWVIDFGASILTGHTVMRNVRTGEMSHDVKGIVLDDLKTGLLQLTPTFGVCYLLLRYFGVI